MESGKIAIQCGSCQASYRVGPQHAGRQVKCRCGELMTVPSAENGTALADPPASEQVSCPGCRQPISPKAVLCVHCGYHLKEGRIITGAAVGPTVASSKELKRPFGVRARTGPSAGEKASREQEAETIRKQKITDVYAPLVMIGIGIPAFLVRIAVQMDPATSFPWIYALAITVVCFIILVPCQFMSVLLTSRIMGTNFGNLIPTVMKLVAMVSFSEGVLGGLRSVMAHYTGGLSEWAIGPVLGFAFFWGLCVWLFDLDLMETFVLYLISSLLPWFLLVFLLPVIWSMF